VAETLLTTEEVSKQLQIPVPTIQMYCRKGVIKAKLIARQFRFRQSDIDDYIASCEFVYKPRVTNNH
jgi:excisionase family DNA binding protein